MNFDLTEEQRMIGDLVSGWLQDNYGFEARQAAMDSPDGWRPEVWQAFAQELGVLGASLPEAAGGLGGGAVENLVVMEQLGSAIFIEPYLESVVLAGALLKHSGWDAANDWLTRIGTGEAILAFAQAEPQSRFELENVATTARKGGDGWRMDGRKAVVHGGAWATHLLVSARTAGAQRDRSGVSLFLVDKATAGVSTRDYPTVDGRRAAEVQLDGAAAELVAEDSIDLIERGVDEAIAAACSEAVGVMRRMHKDTMDYARQRKQFGRPIADFQVLQHRMVDMFTAVEEAVSMTCYATLMLDAEPAARRRAVSAAKAKVGKALRHVGQEAIQIHGGIGMTNELAVGWYFKRATVLESLYGDVEHHLERFQAG